MPVLSTRFTRYGFTAPLSFPLSLALISASDERESALPQASRARSVSPKRA